MIAPTGRKGQEGKNMGKAGQAKNPARKTRQEEGRKILPQDAPEGQKKTEVKSCRAEDKKPIEKIKRIEERTENRERHNGPTKRERERSFSKRG